MFVYDAAGNPTWYVATMDGAKPAGVLTFSGDLYTTHGTWFGAVPYNPANFGAAKVGTMTWQKSFGEPGTLTYSVSGVNVTKSLVRQPIGSDDYTGTYNAGLHLVDSGCTNPAKNGPIDGGDTLAITHIGAAITLMFVKTGCTLGGTYGQNGQFGTASGNYSCSSGDMGTFTLSNMNVTPYSMSALLSTSSTVDGCQGGGQIGGVRNDK
jgi:hypothetical protein